MKLTIENAEKLGAGQRIRNALAAIERRGGRAVDHSAHQKTAQLWMCEFPGPNQVQIGIPLNKGKLSFYLRGGLAPGDAFERTIEATGAAIEPPARTDGRHTALNRWKGLSPERGRVILVDASDANVEALLDLYLARAGVMPATAASAGGAVAAAAGETELDNGAPPSRQRPVTRAMLLSQLDRKDAVGRPGERIAYADEIARLTALGCPDPSSSVQILAEADVGAGYDIRSSWNGETRCIEVKSSGDTSNDFFVTANERETLSRLAGDAWLYRVHVDSDWNGRVVQRVQDPMAKIPEASMQPVVWRVDAAAIPDDAPAEGT